MATFQTLQQRGCSLTEAEQKRLEREILLDLRKTRDEINDKLKKLYAEKLAGISTDNYYATVIEYGRLEKLLKETDRLYMQASRTYKGHIATSSEIGVTNNYLRQLYATTGFASVLGDNVKFAMIDPAIIEASVFGSTEIWAGYAKAKRESIPITDYTASSGLTLTEIVTTHNARDIRNLRSAITQSMIDGDSYAKTAKKIKDIFNTTASNAMRIVRTEGTRNMNAGTYASSQEAKAQGVELKRQWLTSGDSRVRDTHQTLDMQFEDKDGLFHLGSLSTRYPGNFGVASEDINERCTVIDVIEGLEPQLRRFRNPVTGQTEVASFSSFDEWLKDKGINKNARGVYVEK